MVESLKLKDRFGRQFHRFLPQPFVKALCNNHKVPAVKFANVDIVQ